MYTVQNSDEFDLETFINLFDTAMSSKNPAVQKALKNLLLLAAIVREDEINVDGPLRRLTRDMMALQLRLAGIDAELAKLRSDSSYYSYHATGAVGANVPVGTIGTGGIGGAGSNYYVSMPPNITIDSSAYLASMEPLFKTDK